MKIHRFAQVGVAVMALGVVLTGTVAAEAPDRDDTSVRYSFTQLMAPNETRFTQLLGINDHGVIAGYNGDENTEMTPNKGFTLKLTRQGPKFTEENFPGAVQTQVVGINNNGDTVGFWIDGNQNAHGFSKLKGKDPVTLDLPGTTFNQLLGINNRGQAVGYFQDGATPPQQHAYVREANGEYRVLSLPMPSSQATSINDNGVIVGFLQQSTADTKSEGFVLKNGKLTTLQFPGATFTQALGINNSDDVVGFYNDAAGNAQGFLYEDGNYHQISVPGMKSTTINGINNHDQIVGFSVDNNNAAPNTFGISGLPKS